MASALQTDYPWTSRPLITCAPMRMIATAPLTIAVSRAGGLGFLGAGEDLSTFSSLMESTLKALATDPIQNTPSDILPVGVGFLCWRASLSTALQVIEDAPLKPAAAWLFAPEKSADLVAWAEGIRRVTNGKTKIWIQVGTVALAVEMAKTCKPDVLVIQGADAGGHGLAQSSSIISLLPECADTLARGGFGHIPLIATGGIVDGRATAAAFMLGAHGVCLGTRFLATPEAAITNGYRQDVLRASDGGVSTARTHLYDKLRGIPWPKIYNGRAVLNHSYWDNEKGLDEEENKRLYAEAVKAGDEGWGENGRMTTYAGTGVGLIREIKPAGEVVKEIQAQAEKLLGWHE